MANLMTLSRLLLLLLVVWIAYLPTSAWQYANFVLIIIIFVTDGLDGYIARKRNEETLFGALFDIAGDRIVELTLWIIFADLGLIPIWVPLIFVIRGTVVDTIRSSRSQSAGDSPFAMMQTPLGKWLVAGKFMRIFYAVIKAAAFCILALVLPSGEAIPQIWEAISIYFSWLALFLVYLSVFLCLARGIPVVAEFVNSQKPAFTLGKKPKAE